MANRSYLYAIDFDRTKSNRQPGEKINGLSEYPYAIPLAYQILVSQDTQGAPSIIWDYEHPIAIQGDYSKGKQKLFDFLAQLRQEDLFEAIELENQIDTAHAFLNQKQLRHVLLECCEIYSLEEGTLEDQNKAWVEKLEGIDELIENQVKEFRAIKTKIEILRAENQASEKENVVTKIQELEQQMWNSLGINYWDDLLYYHFDKE